MILNTAIFMRGGAPHWRTPLRYGFLPLAQVVLPVRMSRKPLPQHNPLEIRVPREGDPHQVPDLRSWRSAPRHRETTEGTLGVSLPNTLALISARWLWRMEVR